MPSPFPGMDPYIERPEIWPDFHDSLIAAIRGVLQPSLRPRYAALTQDRLYVTESHRPIYPDVGIIRTSRPQPRTSGSVAILEADAPATFELEEVRQPYIEIIEPAAGNRIVTAIEVLSPTNKAPCDGQESYLKKRGELWAGGVNLIEIDLLRGGELTVRAARANLELLRPWHYLVAVTRCSPRRGEIYAMRLRERLARVSVPLAGDDEDVTLDLQAAFTRCWDDGAYPELLRYGEAPPGPLSEDDRGWCEKTIADWGHGRANE